MLLFETYAESYFELEARRRTLRRDVRGLLRVFRESDCRVILDLGCGSGEHAAVLQRAGLQVVGVDRSAAMIQVARSRFPEPVFARADLAELSELRSALASQTVDGAYCLFGTLNYLDESERVLSALRALTAVLREGGVLVLEVWNPEAYRQLSARGHSAPSTSGERIVTGAFGTLRRRRSARFDPATPDSIVIQHDYLVGDLETADWQREEHRLRLYSGQYLAELAERAGLRLRATHGDLSGKPATASSAGLVLLFEKEAAHIRR